MIEIQIDRHLIIKKIKYLTMYQLIRNISNFLSQYSEPSLQGIVNWKVLLRWL